MSNYQPDPNKVRELAWFDKKGSEYIVGSEPIDMFSGTFLSNLLAIGDDDDPELFGHYSIPDEQVLKLQMYVKHRINTKKYNYYTVTYART